MIPLPILKLHLRVDPDETVDDTLIMEMEQAAVAYMQNETGNYYGPVGEITETLSANGWAAIWLQARPLPDSVETPVTLELRATGGDWEPVDAADFEIDGQRLYPLAYWVPGVRTLRLTYTAGYEEGSEPADVKQAVRELVTRMYEKRLPYVDSSMTDLIGGTREIIRANKVTVV